MAEHPRTPPPHGDPLRETVEPNQAQRQSDAPGDASQTGSDVERDRGHGSTASGMPAADQDAGETRRRQYSDGAEIVSKID